MKGLLIGTIAIVFFATLSLSAQTTQTTPTKETQITNVQDNSLQLGKQSNNNASIGKQRQNKNNCTEVCDGTNKRLHQKINKAECNGTGKRKFNKGRR